MPSSQPTRLAPDARAGVKTFATGNSIHRVLPTKRNPTNNPSVPPYATTKVESPHKSKNGAASNIPPEIGLEIFSWILLDGRPGSLAPFCRVSRYYQAQAQRLLYHTVDLRDCDLQKVLSWCLAVTRHEHLARRARSLLLCLPNCLETSDVAKIGGALNRCVNLKELQMLHQPMNDKLLELSQTNSDAWRLINKRPFRLTKFTNTYLDLEWHSQFWEDQSDIRLLSIPDALRFPYRAPGTPRLLPNLVGLEAKPRAIPRVTRSLKHVQVHLHDLVHRTTDLDALNTLSYHAPTLQNLSVVRQGIKNISTFDIVSKAAALLPDLRHLNITEYEGNTGPAEREEELLLPAIEQFTMIESFVLQVRCSKAMHFKGESATNAFDMGSSDDLEFLGVEVMERCPTLRRVEIGAEVPRGCERTCVLKRKDASVEILCIHYNRLKWDATEDFYNSVN